MRIVMMYVCIVFAWSSTLGVSILYVVYLKIISHAKCKCVSKAPRA